MQLIIQKQGFTKDITLEKSVWMSYIKDYNGATLMQCSMLPRVRYVEAGRMLLKQKEAVLAKIRALDKSHVVHQPPKQWAKGVVKPIDLLSIPAVQAAGWSPEMDQLSRESRHGPLVNELRRFLHRVRNPKHAWPFVNPVNKDEVPDYYDVIKELMDLSTIEERLEADHYRSPREMVADLKLMFANCKLYNGPKTLWTGCAVKLEKYMWGLIRNITELVGLLNERGQPLE